MSLYRKFGFKIIAGVVLASMILLTIAPVLLFPKPVAAQGGVNVTIGDIPRILEEIKKSLEKAWEVMKKQWAAMAWKNAVRVMVGELAKGTAEWLAGIGAKEQKPMFITNPKEFWLNAGDQALGVLVEDMTKGTFLEGLGCEMLPDVQLGLIMEIGNLRRTKIPAKIPEAKCPISQRWENLKASAQSSFVRVSSLVKSISQAFSDIGVIIENDQGINDEVRRELRSFVQEYRGIRDKVDNVLVTIGAAWLAEGIGGAQAIDKAEQELNNLLNDFTALESSVEPRYNQARNCWIKNKEQFCTDYNCLYFCLDGKNKCDDFKNQCWLPAQRSATHFGSLIESGRLVIAQLTELKETLVKAKLPPEEMAQIGSLEDLIKQFSMEGNPLGVSLKGLLVAQEKRAEEERKELLSALVQGIKPVETQISGEVKTPAELVKKQAEQPLEKSTKAEETFTGELAADFISVFTSTLAGKLFERFFLKEGLNPQVGSGTQRGTGGGGWQPGGREEIKSVYADLATVSFLRGSGIVNIVDEFATCPNETKYAGQNHCVIDMPFAQAIRQNLTIKEAIEKNYLHGDWYVGGLGLNDKASDFSSRYSLTNIKKLRKARIVPLGLEIAAEKITRGDFGDAKFTLSQIVDDFNKANSNFYRLVDPNWVLKAPAMQCETVAYSAVPLAGSSERQTVCLDLKDCIGENPDGSCHTYGYCTREKNIWRMTGTECPAYYNSCQAYTRVRDNQQFSWLKDTLDFDGCDQNNAGCKWYCQIWDNNNNTWACLNGPELINGKSNIIFFNRQVGKCDSSADGCNEFIQTKEGLGTNLLPNSSFEDGEKCDLAEICQLSDGCQCNKNGSQCLVLKNESNCPLTVTGWIVDGGQFFVDGLNSKSGKVVARINDAQGGPKFGNEIKNRIESWLIPGFSYTLSVWVKNSDNQKQTIYLFADPVSGGPALPPPSQPLPPPPPLPSQPSSPLPQTYHQEVRASAGISYELFKQELPINSGWRRLVYTFTYPLQKNNTNLDIKTLRWEIRNSTTVGRYVYFDDLQLETGMTASVYTDYSSKNLIYLKKAPDWMKCYDSDPSNDAAECLNFIKSCRQDEAGCELYTPTTGEPAIPAIVNSSNYCPKECLGYETFKEISTNFSVGRDLVNFIPQTGRFCLADHVGCEEFTNLDVVAKGGEGREYYSYIRQCLKLPESANQCSYYYTWVGSDITGYQLRRYYLKKDGNTGGPAIVPNPRRDLGNCSDHKDVINNPHCKQFYDAAGQVYYRIYENTITCSESCFPYRKTKPAIYEYTDYNGDENINDDDCRFIVAEPAEQDACQKILSDPYRSGKCCIKTDFMAIPAEGLACSSVNAGCREYKGNAAYNIRQVFLDDFETGTISPWGTETLGAILEPSTESIYFGGRSMKAKITSSQPKEITLEKEITGQVSQGKSYLISFLIKNVSAGQIRFGITGSLVQSATVDNDISDWRLITIGPLYLKNLPSGEITLIISATTGLAGESTHSFFIDNILLREVQESIYLIKDSWTTPQVCDRNNESQYVPGFMLHCKEYRDRFGKAHYLKEFTRLCQESMVGCQALIETKNSTNPFEEKFNITSPDDPIDNVIVPQDEMTYFVVDRNKSCQAKDSGCAKFGLPTLDANKQVTGWLTQFLRNNPDQYNKKPILCQAVNLDCEEFRIMSTGASIYFKDSGEKICQWREKVLIGTEYKTGWFKKGTNQPCYENYLPDDLTYGIRFYGEPDYQGWVGECQERFVGCNEYIDPLGQEGKNLYYYLDNHQLDKSSCNGSVSLKEGCILFFDSSKPEKNYSSDATYEKSADNQYHLVMPVDCTKKPWQDDQGDCGNENYKETDYCLYCEKESEKETLDGVVTRVNDSNLILKVKRDRVCGEWLYCAGSHTVWDPSLNENREVCDAVIRCDKIIGQGSSAECVSFPNVPAEVLNEEKYKLRDISWSGMDYSGYSLFNFYPIEKLQPKKYDNEYKLTFITSGNEDRGVDGLGKRIAKTCQAYPEKDSPFVSKGKIGEFYPQVNFCENSGGEECQCFYKKAQYGAGGGIVKYFNQNDVSPLNGVCISGAKNKVGGGCDNNAECGSVNGVCEVLTKETTYLGQRGFCLEPDPTKPNQINACLTWWPAGAAVGDPDIYNQYQSAGYFAESNRQWYCVEPQNEFSKNLCDHAKSNPVCNTNDLCSSQISTNWLKEDLEDTLLEDCDGDVSGNCPFEKLDGCPISDERKRDVSYSPLNKVYPCDNTCTTCFHIDGNGDDFVCECTAVLKYGFDKDTTPEIPKDVIKSITLTFKSDDETSGNYRCAFSRASDWQTDDWVTLAVCEENEWGGDLNDACEDGMKSYWTNGDNLPDLSDDFVAIQVEWKKEGSDPDLPDLLEDAKLVLKFRDGSPDDGGFETTGFKINFKAPCKYLYKIAADNNNLTTAWTNRLKLKPNSSNPSEANPYEDPPSNGWKSYAYECVPRGATARDSAPENSSSMIIESNDLLCQYYTGGIYEDSDSLSQLFAKSYEPRKKFVYYEEAENYTYKWVDDENGTIDIRSSGRGKEYAPRVASVCFDTAGKPFICRDEKGNPQSGLTIGRNQFGNIIRTKAYTAVVKFYGWADRNQMPIRELVVDWDDGTKTGENFSMLAKNHKEKCSMKCYDNKGLTNEQVCITNKDCSSDYNQCLETFGDSADACVENYWQFTHTYICKDKDSPGWGNYGCGDACCFKPKVYLKDNWGWCAGARSVGNGWVGDGSCANNGGTNVSYKDLIIVKP